MLSAGRDSRPGKGRDPPVETAYHNASRVVQCCQYAATQLFAHSYLDRVGSSPWRL